MAIGSVSSATANNLQASSLTVQDFLKILGTQLQYQDPLKPMDNQQFMAQMAQFTTLQQTQELNSKLDTLINNQSALQSVGLIGRTVDVNAGSGITTGTVTALSFVGDTPTLTLKTAGGTTIPNISLGQITAVR